MTISKADMNRLKNGTAVIVPTVDKWENITFSHLEVVDNVLEQLGIDGLSAVIMERIMQLKNG